MKGEAEWKNRDTYDESSAEEVAIWERVALRGCVGLAMETAAPASRPVETTCSATTTPAAISAILEMVVLFLFC